jgi:hypothetical protein
VLPPPPPHTHTHTHTLTSKTTLLSISRQIRHQIIGRSFADNLKLLQSYPMTDIRHILQSAVQLHHPLPFPAASATPPQRKAHPPRSRSQQRGPTSKSKPAPKPEETTYDSPFEFAFETLKRALS